MHRNKLHLFDHLVGEQLHRIGNHEAKRLCSLEVEDEIEWLFHRNLANAATRTFQRTNVTSDQAEHRLDRPRAFERAWYEDWRIPRP